MTLALPIMLGAMTVLLLSTLPCIRYLSCEMAASIGLAVTVLTYHWYDWLGLQWLENLIGLR